MYTDAKWLELVVPIWKKMWCQIWEIEATSCCINVWTAIVHNETEKNYQRLQLMILRMVINTLKNSIHTFHTLFYIVVATPTGIGDITFFILHCLHPFLQEFFLLPLDILLSVSMGILYQLYNFFSIHTGGNYIPNKEMTHLHFVILVDNL